MLGQFQGRPGDNSRPLVEVSTGDIVEEDCGSYAIGVDTRMFARLTAVGKQGIYLKGRREPILLTHGGTMTMQVVSSFGPDPNSFAGIGGFRFTAVYLGDLAEIQLRLSGFGLGW